jgi:hypothetical protein
MITGLAILNLIVHVGVPLALILWLALARPHSRAHWLTHLFMVGVLVTTFYHVGAGWGIVSMLWRPALLVCLMLAAVWSGYSTRHAPLIVLSGARGWPVLVLMLGVVAFLSASLPEIKAGHAYDGKPVALHFPLEGERFNVMHGGSVASLNHHVKISAQVHALDISALDEYGMRAEGLFPDHVDQYHVFGTKVVAPCTGTVAGARSDLVDLVPPKMDSANLMGNYIILHCGEFSVLLAHLKHGSVSVALGEFVKRGHPVGRVGNTGNTSEPHLHIHAVRGGVSTTSEIAISGMAVPMLFDGNYLVRNDVVEVR